MRPSIRATSYRLNRVKYLHFSNSPSSHPNWYFVNAVLDFRHFMLCSSSETNGYLIRHVVYYMYYGIVYTIIFITIIVSTKHEKYIFTKHTKSHFIQLSSITSLHHRLLSYAHTVVSYSRVIMVRDNRLQVYNFFLRPCITFSFYTIPMTKNQNIYLSKQCICISWLYFILCLTSRRKTGITCVGIHRYRIHNCCDTKRCINISLYSTINSYTFQFISFVRHSLFI